MDVLLSKLQSDAATTSCRPPVQGAASATNADGQLAPTRLQPGMPRPLTVQWKRAAELLIRRKQLAELELCQELNTAASWWR